MHSSTLSLKFTLAAGVAICIAISDVSRAQPAISPEVGRVTHSSPIVEQHVSLDLLDVPLTEALRRIALQGSVNLLYNSADLPAGRRVTLRLVDTPVLEGLRLALRGTDLALRETTVGVVLEKRARQTPPRGGGLTGHVLDAETHASVPRARITVARSEAVTDDSGQYRIIGLPAGMYNVGVRRIGYERAERRVTIIDDKEAILDFEIRPVPNQLDQVVVTGTVVPTEVRALPSPVSIVTAKDIERQSVRRLDQLFRQLVPGSLGPNWDPLPANTTMSVRGASSLTSGTGLKVYLDGIELANQNAAVIDPNSIERIEVIRGPEATAIYGSGAIGGVMQVFTKRGVSGAARPQVTVETTFGLVQSPYVGSGAPRQAYTGAVRDGSEHASYALGGGYTRSGAWVPQYSLASPSAYGGIHLGQGALGFDISGRLTTQTYDNPIAPELVETGFYYYSKPYNQRAQTQEETYGARLTYSATPSWQHTLTVGVDRFGLHQYTTQPRLTTPADTFLTVSDATNRKASIAYNTSAVVSLPHATSATITVGADHYTRLDEGYYTAGALTTSGSIQTDPKQPAVATHNPVTNTGYFGQAQVGIHDAFFLTGGLRGEQNSGFGDALSAAWSPRGGVSYVRSLGAVSLKLRASYGEAIDPPPPTYKSGSISPRSVQLANPDLRPRRQVGGDGGFDLVVGSRGSFSVTYYAQTARDLIQPVYLSPDTLQYQNVGQVDNTGWEFQSTFNVDRVQVQGQYAITHSTVGALGSAYTGDLRVGDQVLLIPYHVGGASLTTNPLRHTGLTAGLTYVGSRTFYDLLSQYRCYAGTGPCRGTAQRDWWSVYPAYTKINLAMTQQITPAVSALVSIENLANRAVYEVSNAFPRQGRITMVGMRIVY